MLESSYPDIRSLHLFSEMADENFVSLMRGAYVQVFPPLIELIREGDPSDFLHVITAGSVDLFCQWNGRETTMATVRPISTFILAASVRSAPNLMSARTLEKCRIVLIPSQDVLAAFDADNAFARAIVTELAQCYRTVIKSKKDLKLRTSLERLANYLLREQQRVGGDKGFELSYQKRRLASFLGMTPENLSRAFRALQAYGVSVVGTRVVISDQDKLERFAKPNPLIDDFST